MLPSKSLAELAAGPLPASAGLLPNPRVLHIGELAYPEQVLVWTLRGVAQPGELHRWLLREFCLVFGGPEDAWRAFEALRALARLLATNGRRPFRVQPLDHHSVGADERAWLALIAATQGRRHDHAAALLAWLFIPAVKEAARGYACALASAMERSGRLIPCRALNAAPAAATEVAPAETLKLRAVT